MGQNLATALSLRAGEVRGVNFYGVCFLNFQFLTVLYNLFSFGSEQSVQENVCFWERDYNGVEITRQSGIP
jgi:hypothetical protein